MIHPNNYNPNRCELKPNESSIAIFFIFNWCKFSCFHYIETANVVLKSITLYLHTTYTYVDIFKRNQNSFCVQKDILVRLIDWLIIEFIGRLSDNFLNVWISCAKYCKIINLLWDCRSGNTIRHMVNARYAIVCIKILWECSVVKGKFFFPIF